ncbi:hypothetical protein HETIRDRAFT_454430 [Heterobasidion irregulare TC 32-1]|uniref:Fungal-type protein kinase domain-containing protein n=1 Tax=Heterobasidion irregulare (strain TC 32-1) TaxID=747525 RepID=W4JTX1_HETIT|nr:uncharacterized protein HETIRDRAFT_454430 [Heterobasidion irregulare TC 32-1]ETW77003.1 hypothetical protein HETIRDRAFT_454430 [Heterobasidion irregulare TC 32-1]
MSSHKIASAQRFSAMKISDASAEYALLAEETENDFHGPMPITEFFDAFMKTQDDKKPPKRATQIFKNIPRIGKFEDHFKDAVEASGICQKLRFVNTTDNQDADFKRKPDMVAYKRSLQGGDVTDFEPMELCIERKPETKDPFKYLAPSATSGDTHTVLSRSQAATKNRGQICSYAGLQLSAQNRFFLFTVVLLGDYVRFIRWDRAGAIVTERVNWRRDPTHLIMFLWRFNSFNDVQRGRDTSLTKPMARDIKRAKKAFDERARFLARLLGEDEETAQCLYSSDATFHQFCVTDDDTHRKYYFIASKPHWQSGSPFGRATDGYIAYDITRQKLVYLKNSWRYLEDGIEKEGATYRHLERSGVTGISTLICSQDILGQDTRTHEYSSKEWFCKTTNPPRRHRLHRLVLGDIGRPLSQFRSSKELVSAMHDGMKAHDLAFRLAHVRHGDLSAGNILISDSGKGILIDWDLAMVLPDVDDQGVDTQGSTTKWQTGTWQFISAARLMDPNSTRHELRDELESGLHVLLYTSVRYRASHLPVAQCKLLKKAFIEHFDSRSDTVQGRTSGGHGKYEFFQVTGPSAFSQPGLKIFLNTPLASLIETLRRLFVPLYSLPDMLQLVPTMEQSRDAALEVLKTSDRFIEIIEEHLEMDGWTENDLVVEG